MYRYINKYVLNSIALLNKSRISHNISISLFQWQTDMACMLFLLYLVCHTAKKRVHAVCYLSLPRHLFLDWEVASSIGWPGYSQVQLCQLWPHASAPRPRGHGSKHRSWRGVSLQGNPCWNMPSSIQLEYGLCGVLEPLYQGQSHYKGHLHY